MLTHCALFYGKLYDLRAVWNILDPFIVIDTHIVVYLKKFYT